MDCNSAYILFYERQNIDFSQFMPDIEGKEPDLQEIDDEFESDLKKACVLQWFVGQSHFYHYCPTPVYCSDL